MNTIKTSLLICALFTCLLSPAAQAAPPGSDASAAWFKVVVGILSGASCQNRLVPAERERCIRKNREQACRDFPEGIEKENCLKELPGVASQPTPSGTQPSGADYALKNVIPASTQDFRPPVKTDDLDSPLKQFISPPAQSPTPRTN
ncbi:hypothetical protein ACWHY4_25735 [Pseudomonas sp. E2-15]|uniref:hypothetical protein n=1 Tax=Pseudomonas sp. D47 TaxID=3159447 RepID=UPI00387B6A39